MNIILDDNELLIKGDKDTLIEFANYILSVANSKEDIDHIHLDELTLIDDNSSIKSLIIEKD